MINNSYSYSYSYNNSNSNNDMVKQTQDQNKEKYSLMRQKAIYQWKKSKGRKPCWKQHVKKN